MTERDPRVSLNSLRMLSEDIPSVAPSPTHISHDHASSRTTSPTASTYSSDDSLVIVAPRPPQSSNMKAAAVVAPREKGSVGEDGKETLEAMRSPPLPAHDGGVEAVVGAAQGKAPEVLVTAKERDDDDDKKSSSSSSSSILDKIKKFADGRNRSSSVSTPPPVPQYEDSTGQPTPMPRSRPKEDPMDVIEPDAKALPPSAVKIVTDDNGEPVPTEIKVPDPLSARHSANTAGTGTSGTSLKDELSEQYDLSPAVSADKFHAMFADSVPESEELIEDYRCALVRDILVQGRMFVTEGYLAFKANILGWETSLAIPWSEITTVEKRTTLAVIPNAIDVCTLHSKHTFASLMNRDSTYDLLVECWRHAHPEEQRVRARADNVSTALTNDANEEARSEITYEAEDGKKKKHRFTKAIQKSAIAKKLKTVGLGGGGSGSEDEDDDDKAKTPAEKVKEQALASDPGHKPTEYDGKEYDKVALDVVLPVAPEKAYDLFFGNESFLRPFLEETEKLKEVDIGEWESVEGSSTLKKREMSYIKPLNASMGPKETKCLISDQNEQCDPETYFANETTTRTPDVPAGKDFSVRTKSVFTWSEYGGTHVRVTTEVEWTKTNRMLKGIIERSCVDGQKTYHADLEKAARAYIDSHTDEFKDSRVNASASSAAPPSKTEAQANSNDDNSGGLLNYIPLAPSTIVLALFGLTIVLLATNFFTLLALRHQARAAHGLRVGHPGEVANAVSRVLDDFSAVYNQKSRRSGTGAGDVEKELASVVESVKVIERGLKEVVDRLVGLGARL